MKTAIYIEDGVVQLVITPESEFEKNAVKSFQNKPLDIEVFDGSFYDCQGGWTRQSLENDVKSLIMRMSDAKPKERDPIYSQVETVLKWCQQNIDDKTNVIGFAVEVRDCLERTTDEN